MKKSLIALSLLAALTAQASDNHKHDEHKHDEKVEHIGPHVHGVAALNVVLDGDDLTVELDSPAMNVVGFEHKPEAEADLNQSHDAIHKLKDGEWLVINGGDCELEDADVDWQYKHILHEHFHADKKDEGEDKHEHKDEHKHEHKDEHKHGHDHDDHDDKDHDDKKEAHEHHHDHDHKDGETHSDVESKHQFECKKPAEIKTVSVDLFDAFAGFEKLNVQWIVNDKQGAMTLTKDNHVLKLQ